MTASKNENEITEKVKAFYEKYPYPPPEKDITKTFKWLTKVSGHFRSQTVLDVGCGTGSIALRVAKEAKKVHAIDAAKSSIGVLVRKARAAKIENVLAKTAELTKWKPKIQYDHVLCIGVLHHTAQPSKNFQRISKWVKKEGKLTIGVYTATNTAYNALQNAIRPLSTKQRIWLLQKLMPKRSTIELADTYAHPQKSLHTLKEVRDWYKKADFVVKKYKEDPGFLLITGTREKGENHEKRTQHERR